MNNNERRLAEALFATCSMGLPKEDAVNLIEITLKAFGVNRFNSGAEEMHRSYIEMGDEAAYD